MATFAVTTHHVSVGNLAGVINEVTGDGSTQTWETGLSRVMFYTAVTSAQTTISTDTWFLNYSDDGTTAANGHVYFGTAPEDGEVFYCFGLGKP